MARLSFKPLAPRVKILLSVFMAALIALNWLPYLDDLAQTYLTDTIASNAVVFGLVRSLNGIISVVQSAEVGVGVAGISIGEIFDPVNDLIERFSGLLLFTLTALGIQQVILLFTTSVIMKAVFTLVALASTAALWWQDVHWARWLRIIFTLCLLRFLLSLEVGFVWLFDWLYFNATGAQAMSVLEASAQVIETLKDTITNIDLGELIFGDGQASNMKSDDVSALISTSVVTLIVGMLFKSILIPLGTLWIGYKLAQLRIN